MFRPAMKLIDVSVPIDANLATYPGNTPFNLEAIKRIGRGDSSNVSTLHLSAHTGTHVDAPRHFFDDGPGTEALPLEMLIGRARVIEVTSRKGIAAEDLASRRRGSSYAGASGVTSRNDGRTAPLAPRVVAVRTSRSKARCE